MSTIVPINQLIDELPTGGATTAVLRALDFIVPGQWVNDTSFDDMVRRVTGETDDDVVAQVAGRTVVLFLDEEQGLKYRRALKIFSIVDTVDQVAAATAMASKIGQNFSFLGFLDKLTPKSDTTQAIDAGLKLVAEISAFMLLNGLPKDGLGDFVESLGDYGKADLMRLAAWVAIDGLVPLGPDFMEKIISGIDGLTSNSGGGNKLYDALSDYVPGDSAAEKQGFIKNAMSSSAGWVKGFVDEKGLTQDLVVGKIKSFVNVADSGLDYLAAGLDATTNYFEHTGTQTVARFAIIDAYGQIQAEMAQQAIAAAQSHAEMAQAARHSSPIESHSSMRAAAASSSSKQRLRAMAVAAALGAMADGEVDPDEEDMVLKAVSDVPLFAGMGDEQILALVHKAVGLIDRRGYESAMGFVASALNSVEDRETAFALAASVQYADDDITAEEGALIFDFGEVLGLSQDRAQAIINAIESTLSSASFEEDWDEDAWGEDDW